MSEAARPTTVTDVQLPIEMVELEHLKTRDGQPVVVRCEMLAELLLSDLFQSLPGGGPPSALNGDGEVEPVERVREMNRFAPALIEAGTVLSGPNGEEVRPAFYFGVQTNPLSIPGRLLREGDKMLLITAIMRLGGYGGAAEAEQFREVGSGSGHGLGVVEVGEGVGTDPLGGNA